MADREPHHIHLAEMRATLPMLSSDEWHAEVRRIRAELAAQARDAVLRRDYPDPTRRHLEEMRRLAEEDRRTFEPPTDP